MSTSTLINKAINDAIRNLNAAGCKYAIVRPDGETIKKDLEVATPKEEKPRSHRLHLYNYRQEGYLEKVAAMKVGEVLELPFIKGVPPGKYRSVISASLVNKFGKGNGMTSINNAKQCIEVMRLG